MSFNEHDERHHRLALDLDYDDADVTRVVDAAELAAVRRASRPHRGTGEAGCALSNLHTTQLQPLSYADAEAVLWCVDTRDDEIQLPNRASLLGPLMAFLALLGIAASTMPVGSD